MEVSTMKKRMLSLLLILCMAVTLLPTAALAAEDNNNALSVTEDQTGSGSSKNTNADQQSEAQDTPALLENEDGGSVANTPVEIQIKDDLTTDSTKDYYTVETKNVPAGSGTTAVNVLTITQAGSYKLTQDDSLSDKWCI